MLNRRQFDYGYVHLTVVGQWGTSQTRALLEMSCGRLQIYKLQGLHHLKGFLKSTLRP